MDTTKSAFRDFIPEGEDTGAYVKGGFQDFVPAPVIQEVEVEPEAKEEAPKAKKKGK